MDVFFGLFMMKFELLSFKFEFLIMFQIEGSFAAPVSIAVGAMATMSPGEFFPSFEMITTTLGEEGKFKKRMQKCAKDDSRDLRLFGGVLTQNKVESNMRVLPSPAMDSVKSVEGRTRILLS